jgi:polyhydroxyalkanoate synthesis regulator phasin
MQGSLVNKEIALLEELMKDKETIFRAEIQTLKETISQLEAHLSQSKRYTIYSPLG